MRFDAARIEVVLDEGNVTLGDRSDPVCELELELKSGDAAALFGLARAIAAQVPVRLGVLTRSARGQRLLDDGGRVVKVRERRAAHLATKLHDHYRRDLKRRGRRLAQIDDEASRELCILARKLGYATGLLGDLDATKPAGRRRKLLAALGVLQSALGALDDEATGQDVPRRLGLDDAATRAADVVHSEALLAEAADAHDEAIDTKRFWR